MPSSVPTTRPPRGGGWRPWGVGLYNSGSWPSMYAEIEVWRAGWHQAELVDPLRGDRLMNIHGLYWRPAGPMRECLLIKALKDRRSRNDRISR